MIDISYRKNLSKPVKKDWSEFKSFQDWIVQRKWDGFRCLLDTTDNRLLNDHGSYKTIQFPDIVEQIDSTCRANCILDGEMIVGDLTHNNQREDFPNLMSRQATQDRLKLKLLRSRYPATYVAFDILKFEGDDCRKLPIEDRLILLSKAISYSSQTGYRRIRIVGEFGLDTPQRIKQICHDSGFEGVVLKQKGSDYYAESVKLKAWQEEEFIITSWNRSESGSRLIGTITVDSENPTNVKWQGEQTQPIAKTLIGKKVLVRYLQPVKAGGKLRFPSMVELIP
jgi:ATP-dependent DNA ligase